MARWGCGRRHDVLLVTHRLERSGAPLVALSVLCALAAAGLVVAVVSRADGELRGEFEKLACCVRSEQAVRLRALLRRPNLTRRLANAVDWLAALALVRRIGARSVYANSALSMSYVAAAQRLGTPTALHVHEVPSLLMGMRRRFPRLDVSRVRWIACSDRHAQLVEEALGLPAEAVASNPVDPPAIARGPHNDAAVESRDRREQTVGACGEASAAKGVELWLRVREQLALDSGFPPHFAWVGRVADPLAVSGPGVTFHGARTDPQQIVESFDVLLSTCPTHVYSLAMLEAMALGVPVVAVDPLGLTAGLLGTDEYTAPTLDASLLADKVRRLLEDEDERSRYGRELAARVEQLRASNSFAASTVSIVRALSA